MQTRWISGLVAIAFFLAGAGLVAAGTIEDEFEFKGRPVRIILPEGFDVSGHERIPLILHLHGAVPFPDVPDLELDNSGYRDLPSQHNVMIAAPRGTFNPLSGTYFWYASTAAEPLYNFDHPDDVQFLSQLVYKLLRDYPIDRRRIYLYGYSNGALMAHRMACERADLFAAMVAGAGELPGNDPDYECVPSMPVSVLHLHSKDDEVVRFNGGNFSWFFGITPDDPVLDYRGAIETIVRWAAMNGCTGVLQFGTEATLDLDTEVAGNETTINRVTQCPPGVDVQLWSMEGVSHPPLSFGVGPNGIKTLAETTWEFLRKHKRYHTKTWRFSRKHKRHHKD